MTLSLEEEVENGEIRFTRTVPLSEMEKLFLHLHHGTTYCISFKAGIGKQLGEPGKYIIDGRPVVTDIYELAGSVIATDRTALTYVCTNDVGSEGQLLPSYGGMQFWPKQPNDGRFSGRQVEMVASLRKHAQKYFSPGMQGSGIREKA